MTYKLIQLFLALILAGCAHGPKAAIPEAPQPHLEPLNLSQPIPLRIKGEPGREELTENCSSSVTKTFSDKTLRFKKIELVEFKVKTHTTEVLKNSHIKQTIEIASKDGTMALHDLAYPEQGEVLDMEITPQSIVKRAGTYKKNSIFFLPPVPLPQKPVSVGDSWDLENSWVSEAGGLPLTDVMHVTFSAIKRCGIHVCAELTVDGSVHMPEKLEKKNGFAHRLTGRFLFEPGRGLLAWSQFESNEHLNTEGVRAEVHSVLRSHLIEPLGYHKASREEPACPLETTEE